MIINVAGKISSGKDTVAHIINFILAQISILESNPTWESDYGMVPFSEVAFDDYLYHKEDISSDIKKFENKKFAGKLKEIVSILTGIDVEKLEISAIKNGKLGEDWTRYGYANGFKHIYANGVKTNVMINEECSKERYEEELKINWQTAYKNEFTPRQLLQYIGTDLFRNKLFKNIWVTALFADYDENKNWIITDCRFENELEACNKKNSVNILIERDIKHRFPNLYADYRLSKDDEISFEHWLSINHKDEHSRICHESEISLDSIKNKFKYRIKNNDSIEKLIKELFFVLIDAQVIFTDLKLPI
jgi:hypothetical protein